MVVLVKPFLMMVTTIIRNEVFFSFFELRLDPKSLNG